MSETSSDSVSQQPPELAWTEQSEKLYELGLISAGEASLRSGIIAVSHQVEPVLDVESAPVTAQEIPRSTTGPVVKNRDKWGGRPPSKRELMRADSRPDLKPFPYGTGQ